MSQSTAVRAARPVARGTARTSPRPAARPAGRSSAPRLRVVAAPRNSRSRAGLVIGCLAALAAGLVGLLLLNVNLEQGAFVAQHQQAQIEQLQERRQSLAEEIARREAPQALAAQAARLGMVEAPDVAFVRTSDGRVLGVASPGVASAPRTVAANAPSAGSRGAAATPSGGTATTSAKVTAPAAATTTATTPITGAGTNASSAPTRKSTGSTSGTAAAKKPVKRATSTTAP